MRMPRLWQSSIRPLIALRLMAFVTSVTPLSRSFCGKSWFELGPAENGLANRRNPGAAQGADRHGTHKLTRKFYTPASLI